jgi:hypothetical protein
MATMPVRKGNLKLAIRFSHVAPGDVMRKIERFSDSEGKKPEDYQINMVSPMGTKRWEIKMWRKVDG